MAVRRKDLDRLSAENAKLRRDLASMTRMMNKYKTQGEKRGKTLELKITTLQKEKRLIQSILDERDREVRSHLHKVKDLKRSLKELVQGETQLRDSRHLVAASFQEADRPTGRQAYAPMMPLSDPSVYGYGDAVGREHGRGRGGVIEGDGFQGHRGEMHSSRDGSRMRDHLEPDPSVYEYSVSATPRPPAQLSARKSRPNSTNPSRHLRESEDSTLTQAMRTGNSSEHAAVFITETDGSLDSGSLPPQVHDPVEAAERQTDGQPGGNRGETTDNWTTRQEVDQTRHANDPTSWEADNEAADKEVARRDSKASRSRRRSPGEVEKVGEVDPDMKATETESRAASRNSRAHKDTRDDDMSQNDNADGSWAGPGTTKAGKEATV